MSHSLITAFNCHQHGPKSGTIISFNGQAIVLQLRLNWPLRNTNWFRLICHHTTYMCQRFKTWCHWTVIVCPFHHWPKNFPLNIIASLVNLMLKCRSDVWENAAANQNLQTSYSSYHYGNQVSNEAWVQKSWLLDPRIKIKPLTENCKLWEIFEVKILLTTAHWLEVKLDPMR